MLGLARVRRHVRLAERDVMPVTQLRGVCETVVAGYAGTASRLQQIPSRTEFIKAQTEDENLGPIIRFLQCTEPLTSVKKTGLLEKVPFELRGSAKVP